MIVLCFPFFKSLVDVFPAGDLKGAIQTLRSLLLFYPSDADSLNNLQLYSETLGGDANAAGTEPSQVVHTICVTAKQYSFSVISIGYLFI